MVKSVKMVKMIEKKMGRAYDGMAYVNDGPARIEIDIRLRGKKQQEILFHELLHHALPLLDEEAVVETAQFLAEHTWKFGMRRIQH